MELITILLKDRQKKLLVWRKDECSLLLRTMQVIQNRSKPKILTLQAVGLYPTNSNSVNKFILEDSRTNIIVVEDSKNVSKILEIKNELPQLKKIIQYSGTPEPHCDVIGWADLMKLGQEENDEILVKRQKVMAINQCAMLVYTSGTTGMPKGNKLFSVWR
jgi:long-subunit acyl-CoA synthetase (AMP-forming)